MNLQSRKSGESVIEVLLTMMIILLAIVSSFKIVSIAFLQKNLTKDRIIAVNLAREGMEAVRYIRDYNWLYYGSERRICWNHYQDNNDSGNLSGDTECSESGSNGFATHQIGTGDVGNPGKMEYALVQNGTHWFLTRAGANGHTITNGDWVTLTKDNVGVNNNGTEGSNTTDTVQSFRLCRDTSDQLYVSCLNSNADTTKRTRFLRYVKIEYPGNPQNTTGDGNGLTLGQKQNRLTMIVGVKFIEKGIMQDVELISKLADFYERNPLDREN